jgi:hypothetical protein
MQMESPPPEERQRLADQQWVFRAHNPGGGGEAARAQLKRAVVPPPNTGVLCGYLITMKIVLMLEAEDQRLWGPCFVQRAGVSFLIKSTFARNLLYLLANRA